FVQGRVGSPADFGFGLRREHRDAQRAAGQQFSFSDQSGLERQLWQQPDRRAESAGGFERNRSGRDSDQQFAGREESGVSSRRDALSRVASERAELVLQRRLESEA